jgi:putative transposase
MRVMTKHYPVEQRERAVKMVLDHLDEYRSVYAACQAIGPKVGVGAESLRRWTLQAQVDDNQRPGMTTAEQQRIKDLEREVRDLKEANEILKAASAFFARELDPRRRGHRVARCTVDRLMRDAGLSGVVRGRRHRTTIRGGADSRRAPDLLDRDFSAAAPNRKWVTDFTYTRTWSGFVYVAFVVDCYSRAIVGWHAATVMDTAMATTALKMALWRRDHASRTVASGLIHHSDAGSQYTSIAFAETLVLEGIAASIGSIGDAYDNALAETTIGLYKTEAVGRNSPFLTGPLKTIDDVEYATMEWVDWYSARRLHSLLDYVPPDEYESAYYAQPQAPQPATSQQ